METQPDERAILKQAGIYKNQALAKNDCHDGQVHWISHIAIKPTDDEMPRWENRRGRA
jgi:hypothetical protein